MNHDSGAQWNRGWFHQHYRSAIWRLSAHWFCGVSSGGGYINIYLNKFGNSKTLILGEEIHNIVRKNSWCTGKQSVRTHKTRSIIIKHMGVSYVNTSMVSTNGIPSRETTIHHKKVWTTRRPPSWGINSWTKDTTITIDWGLTSKSVLSHYIIELQLYLNDENW